MIALSDCALAACVKGGRKWKEILSPGAPRSYLITLLCATTLTNIPEMAMPAPRPVAQNQVPNVAELIDRLGFGTKAQKHNFQTSAKHWRRDYKCTDGTPGKDLIQWGDSRTQGKLRRMTEDFLGHTNIAIKIWPKKTPASPATALEWPTDRTK